MNARKNQIRILFILMMTVLFVYNLYGQTVRINSGLVEGIVEDGITVYKGVPFAAPPVGDLRWRAPQPVDEWEGILKADTYAPACPQINVPGTGYDTYGFSEDCLYLNIWKPNDVAAEKMPVLVWIYGGGFYIGTTSASLTTGEQLARKGLVVVNIAYRIGPLGFLSHPELTSESENHVSGNYGLLDQIAALRWIRDNIEAFGGDPGNVTIFGESAGGQSVSMLAASPLAKGLFHKAICMSGGSFFPASQKKDPENYIQLLKGAETAGVEFGKRMGANSIEELRKAEPQKLLSDPTTALGGFWPVVDGYVITDDQYRLYNSGTYNDVPVLIGYTSDEGTLFTIQTNPSEYAETIRQRFGPFADKILNLYPAGTDSVSGRSHAELFRDLSFGWSAYTWAGLQTKTGKSPVYVYYFDQKQPPSPITFLLKSNGAYHGSDCAYVFGHLDQNPSIKYSEADSRLSQVIMDYWTNFARYGDPNGEVLPQWPAYAGEKPTVMYLKSDLKPGLYPNLDKIRVLDEYFTWKRATADQ